MRGGGGLVGTPIGRARGGTSFETEHPQSVYEATTTGSQIREVRRG